MPLILIVDDAQFTRRVICKSLQKQGYLTREASNGREAIGLLDEELPDCILLDLLMPEFDGWDVLTFLKEHDYTIPVIVITADIQETSRQHCFDLGAKAVINKPPKPDELNNTLKKILGFTEENAR
ncbi:MAG TPA: response regulator [Vampirovibrionales bacterium]